MGQNRRYGDPLTALDEPAVAPPQTGKVRHVWLNLSRLDRAPSAYPGVIIDWRRTAHGWEAQVAYVTDTTDRTSLHVLWCLAEQLTPVTNPGSGS